MSGGEDKKLTAAELHRETGFSKAYISKLKKSGKLIFMKDDSGKEYIFLSDALKQFEASKDYNRDGQRKWADEQRKGKTLNMSGPSLLQVGDFSCDDKRIGVETQRSRLARETYEAYLREMEFKEKNQELISMAGLLESQRRIAVSIRSKLIGLGTKISPRLEGKSISERQEIIDDEINLILTEFVKIGDS
jgi:phage terminase Nu1 subunit (DNA packaging protein)